MVADTAPRFYRRRLPHYLAEDRIYFVTWRLHRSQMPLTPDERTVIAAALEFHNSQKYLLVAYVVMDDHVHVLVLPHLTEALGKIVQSWKSFTANKLQRLHERERHVWQSESYDRMVRDRSELCAVIEYIRANPERRWPEKQEYPWVRIFPAEAFGE